MTSHIFAHDLQDGIAAGMFQLDDIAMLPIAGPILNAVIAAKPGCGRRSGDNDAA